MSSAPVRRSQAATPASADDAASTSCFGCGGGAMSNEEGEIGESGAAQSRKPAERERGGATTWGEAAAARDGELRRLVRESGAPPSVWSAWRRLRSDRVALCTSPTTKLSWPVPAHGPTNSFAPLLRMGRPAPQLAPSLVPTPAVQPALQHIEGAKLCYRRGIKHLSLI